MTAKKDKKTVVKAAKTAAETKSVKTKKTASPSAKTLKTKTAAKPADKEKTPAKKAVKKTAPAKKEIKETTAKKAVAEKSVKEAAKKAIAKKAVKAQVPLVKAAKSTVPLVRLPHATQIPAGTDVKRPVHSKLRMTAAKKKHYKDLLTQELERFTSQLQFHRADVLTAKKDSAGERAGMATHMADLGSDNFRHDMELTLLSEEGDVIQMIEEAMQRIKDSEYGICVECGCEINPERLEAKPYARFCIRCKDKHEQLEEPHRRHR